MPQAKEKPLSSSDSKNTAAAAGNAKSKALSLFFGGILPVIAFTVIEEKYGTMAGLVAGMIFGFSEIVYELIKHRKVSGLTWFGNGLLLGMGAISLWTNEGIWFKLQPAIMEAAFALALWGSWLIKRPLLRWMMQQQGQSLPSVIDQRLSGMTFRLGCFFALHAGLAVWAAYDWSTTNWALLKGVGLTVSMIVYMMFEAFAIRRMVQK